MLKSVFCIATTRSRAEGLVGLLQAQGFAASEISVMLPGLSVSHDLSLVKSSKVSEGVVVEGIAGGALGILADSSVLAALEAGAFVVGGPLVAALSGVAIGATTGGILGGLIGIGIPESDARRYEEKLKEGSCLISTRADNNDQIDRARAIFEEAGAEDIHMVTEAAVPAAGTPSPFWRRLVASSRPKTVPKG
jgi:hypothetical protein